MTAELYAFTCGYLTLPKAMMLQGEQGMLTVPVPAYLIVHKKGRVLFDSGLHQQTLSEPEQYVGELIARYHEFHFEPGQDIASRLLDFGTDPEKIDLVINSHLHFDHCGGNCQLPNADIVIQKKELEHARKIGSDQGYLTSDWNTGQNIRAIDGEYDVFGDGSVVCLPTHGHTPGHQSLKVRTQSSEYILTGDACYLRDTLEKIHLPGVLADPDAFLKAVKYLRRLQSQGAKIMFGHDPEFWRSVPQAPESLQ